MKKLLLFLCFVCASFCNFANNGSLPYPDKLLGDTIVATSTSVCNGATSNFLLPPSLGFSTSCSYSFGGERYYTTEPYITLTFNVVQDTTVVCYIDSVNDAVLPFVAAIVINVGMPPAIDIPLDSIRHVTCPDGDFYPYADGKFHVNLLDPVQNYMWVNVESDSSFFFDHTYNDSFTITGLRSGTYHVVAYGVNGCEYRDSVVIEQPDPWYSSLDSNKIDTVCYGHQGCIDFYLTGGTPPYNFTWFYYSDTTQIFMSDTTHLVCGLYSGQLYYLYVYDSRGCKAFGEEIQYIFWNLYEWVEDSTHIITTDSIACYGGEFMVQAQSIGEGTYTWHVGDVVDSINYWTGVYGDSMFVADYLTPPMLEPTWVYAEFSDQHHCVTRDSIWVEVYNPEVSLSILTDAIVTDSSCTVHVSPPGGNLYLDDALISYNIPENFTFSTAGISVGEHMLKYAGIFGAEIGLACEDEISLPIQVEMNPVVPDWEYDVSIYPNPAITNLNLSSTGIMDFEVSILDITGKVIKTDRMLDQTFTFDVSDLSSGIYMLRLVSHDGASKIVKFVKK